MKVGDRVLIKSSKEIATIESETQYGYNVVTDSGEHYFTNNRNLTTNIPKKYLPKGTTSMERLP